MPLGHLRSLRHHGGSGLDHINHHGAHPHRDPEWVMIHQCIVNWLYTTITPQMLDTVMQPDDTSYIVWSAIEGNFHDNRLTRVFYIEAELWNMCQGDMYITQYCTNLKSLADSLRDIGQPVHEDNQFLRARSNLLLEEQNMEQSMKMEVAQAMFVGRKPSTSLTTPGPDGGSNSSGARSRTKKKKGQGNASASMRDNLD
ncbi:uncharacterized protein LOC133927801 [Phragmites australis]|uniref:uncharacterized protein LOC133927801 n=1 Tax=Phragmites australis TaxID=29695 RepID=UPI002D775DBF|nr:uncharacterized protein LOC133927801 [Phragmites australis]